ncbi:Mitogen-activated protein kinase kinase protein [Dioscorea alata]|uniref:Mitogen-activated protein kinase kinase protein n=2 Tax=Dioscorea alata TaxID=55571 RepID=A0ACB7U363_DIOAL|nr:Mitogen-activated protein kinase kinase protein [Dioscorea alata]KAH7654749.1 Mitogen-activated protein kinase kinase protein [Dioscorea alata]
MERKADLPAPPPSSIPIRPISGGDSNITTSSTSSSSSISLSPPDFLRHVHAVFKRHRPLGTMQSNFSRPARATRVMVSQTESSKNRTTISATTSDNVGNMLPQSQVVVGAINHPKISLEERKDAAVEVRINTAEDSSLTPPSITGTITAANDENMNLFAIQNSDPALRAVQREALAVDVSKKQQFSSLGDAGSVLAFQKGGGGSLNNETGVSEQDLARHNEPRDSHHFVAPITRSSVVGTSNATTMSVHSCPTYQGTHAPLCGQTAFPTQMSSSAVENSSAFQDYGLQEGQGSLKNVGEALQHQHQDLHMGNSIKEKDGSDSGKCSQSLVPGRGNPSSNVDLEPSQSSKVEKVSRKKKYDPDVFFKVNGKLYQKLGKIGSGGSSEVHKVISADRTIYALKKIKLKGRDYPTAYGFCQEIEYLNKLKGKNNIIQLIDFEVTDKTLLMEVVNGSMTIKEGRIKDDEHIYMVLEYGEIDLAHMLSQKWKEIDSSNWRLDENWLRFYWQQMLEAVNTIHEERIVHSDLKPANFLLVRGSLKLIDFGIAKAILSDTTNIQRDAQVGTLNYMSPEAFMWNEHDANGNTIKCGRPSDIWSLGCILYQMVYDVLHGTGMRGGGYLSYFGTHSLFLHYQRNFLSLKTILVDYLCRRFDCFGMNPKYLSCVLNSIRLLKTLNKHLTQLGTHDKNASFLDAYHALLRNGFLLSNIGFCCLCCCLFQPIVSSNLFLIRELP